IYSVAGKMTPMHNFRPASPDSFEEDYDDVSLSESDLAHKPPVTDEELHSQKGKGGTGSTHLLAPHLQRPQGGGGQSCMATSVAILYVLVALNFLAWAVVFTLAIMKQMEIMAELKHLRSNCSENQADVWQELVETRRRQSRLRSRMQKYYEDLQDITAQLCPFIPKKNKKCSAGWKMFERSCYFFSTETMSWLDAKEICADQGAHLVIINSDQEQVSWPLP
ncbi:CL17A protein, partial [Centropus bengalensis]|nr:CL17A protein [Centropus bengalensis]